MLLYINTAVWNRSQNICLHKENPLIIGIRRVIMEHAYFLTESQTHSAQKTGVCKVNMFINTWGTVFQDHTKYIINTMRTCKCYVLQKY